MVWEDQPLSVHHTRNLATPTLGLTEVSTRTQIWTWDARRVTDSLPAMRRQRQRLATTLDTRTRAIHGRMPTHPPN